MAIQENQLARIIAPEITDSNYTSSLREAFKNINENFKKIASLPFLQGVQGDSYQLKEYDIFIPINSENTLSKRNAKLTQEGALLLNSIFDTTVFSKDSGLQSYFNENYYDIIGNPINEKLSLDGFIDENGEIINNKLYFYVIIDDSGYIIEDSKHLGQYFYFVDGRIKNLGNVYNSDDKKTLEDFNDFTGFFQYITPENKYEKIDIIPTLYYDKLKNDICWKFNGKDSGISAIGISGTNGKDSTFFYVATEVDSSTVNSGQVLQVFNNDGWSSVLDSLENSMALICIKTNDGNVIHSFGEIRKTGDSPWFAYWSSDLVIEALVTNTTINQYFYKMGSDTDGNYPHYLAIPVDRNRNSGDKKAHVLISENNNTLTLKGVEKAWNEYDNQLNVLNSTTDELTLKIENYDIDVNNNDINKIGTIQGATAVFTKGIIDNIETKTITGVTGNIDNINSNKITVENKNNNYKTKIEGQNTILYDNINRPVGRIHIASIVDNNNKYAHMRISSAPFQESGSDSPFYTGTISGTKGGYLDLFAHGNDMWDIWNSNNEIRPGIRIQDVVTNGTPDKSVNVYSKLNIRSENGNSNKTVLNVVGVSEFNGKSNFNKDSEFKQKLITKQPIYGDNVFGYISGDPTADANDNTGFKKCTKSTDDNDGWTPIYPYTYLLINNESNHRYLMFDANVYPKNSVVFVTVTGDAGLTFNGINGISQKIRGGKGMYAFYLCIETHTTLDGTFRKVNTVINVGNIVY